MDKTQSGVATGAAGAALVGLISIVLAAKMTPSYLGETGTLYGRLIIAAIATLAPTLSLIFCVARLANHRFFSPEDINGSALTQGSEKAKLLQALLQNTLEQATLAVSTYFSSAILFPSDYLGAILASGIMFCIGRIAFFVGYKNGASSRAFGFAFTFYPTIFLIVGAAYFVITQIAA